MITFLTSQEKASSPFKVVCVSKCQSKITSDESIYTQLVFFVICSVVCNSVMQVTRKGAIDQIFNYFTYGDKGYGPVRRSLQDLWLDVSYISKWPIERVQNMHDTRNKTLTVQTKCRTTKYGTDLYLSGGQNLERIKSRFLNVYHLLRILKVPWLLWTRTHVNSLAVPNEIEVKCDYLWPIVTSHVHYTYLTVFFIIHVYHCRSIVFYTNVIVDLLYRR